MASYTYGSVELGDQHALGCKCCRFARGDDLPIPKNLSIDEVKQHAVKFSGSIFKDWTMLNAILKRFEATIQKRWLKKTPKQKREILLKAWPAMPAHHRPDFAGFRGVLKTAPRSRTLPSAAYLWPYINLEDLQQRHLLPLFLHSRGRNLPEMFVFGDVRNAHLGGGWKGPPPPSTETPHTIVFQGCRTPRTYGQPMPKLPNSAKKQQMVSHDSKQGLLALEIQQHIYSFLLACTKLILHDVEPSQFFLAPNQPSPGVPTGLQDEWPSLSSHMLEMPYRTPATTDLHRLKSLVGARRAAAEDHLWVLREDPGYFVENLQEWKEHDEDAVKNDGSWVWRMVASNMISNAYTSYLYWDWIYRRLVALPSLDEQFRRANHQKLRLAREDEQIWVELQVVVRDMAAFCVMQLSIGLHPAPRLRHIYNDGALTSAYHLTEAERRVDLLFTTIINDEKRELHGEYSLVQEVQYMLDTDPKASQLVDPWLLRQFSDLAMLAELKDRMDGLEPWSTGWWNNKLDISPCVIESTGKLFAQIHKLRAAFDDVFSNPEVIGAILGDPTDGRFEYPAAKRHTEANVKVMRFSEVGLDLFWEELEGMVRKKTPYSLTNMIDRRLYEPRELYRTPEWVPQLVEVKSPQPLLNTNVPTFGAEPKTPDVIVPAKPKEKIKTRGIPAPPTDERVDSTNPPPPTSEQTHTVPKRAYKVLSALLPDANACSHQRTEIAWDELLQALNTIGLQPEKLYGSVWVFTPKSRAEDSRGKEMRYWVPAGRSIQFHEPKEVRRGGKMAPFMVRNFGRRLKHAFGWEGGMFVCE